MQRYHLFLFMTALLFLGYIAPATAQQATNITLYRQEYQAGETVQAEILTPNALRTLAANQIAVFDADGKKIAIAPFLFKRAENSYVLYFDLPYSLKVGEYLFEIQKIPYEVNNTLQEETAQQKIPIVQKTISVLAISPAFVFLKQTQTEIDLTLESKRGTIKIAFNASEGINHVYKQQQVVQEKTKRTFKFTLNQTQLQEEDGFIDIFYETIFYHIPLFRPQQQKKNISVEEEIIVKTNALELVTALKQVNRTISQDQMLSGPLAVKNNGNETLVNISVQLTGNLQEIIAMNESIIAQLEPNAVKTLYFWVNREKQAKPGFYSGEMRLESATASITLPFYLTVLTTEGEIPPSETYEPPQPEETNRSVPFPLFNETGIPTVKAKKSGISAGSIIFIIFFVLLIILFFLFKNKKSVQKSTFKEYINNRERKF